MDMNTTSLRFKTAFNMVLLCLAAGCASPALAQATAPETTMGVTTLGTVDRPITVFYPSRSPAQRIPRGELSYNGAPNAPAVAGNQRLIVLSHGSGGSPLAHTGLAQALVNGGYIVAMPEHAGDNYRDHSLVGPPSWKLRPAEVSAAIDAVTQDARFAPLFDAQRVGMWGMSAGGHTALTLAGGRWAPARLLAHCEANLTRDYATCTGAATRLDGGVLDGPKQWIAMPLIRRHLKDDLADYGHTDPRLRAVAAGVPLAVDFDPQSLAQPVVALGLIQAQADEWLVPEFHSAAIMATCKTCEWIADLPSAGHGALLDPLPTSSPARIQRLLDDPKDFDRATVLPDLYRRTLAFFDKHLL